MARLLIAIVVSLFGFCQAIQAETNTSLSRLLNQNEAPEGVVFEIVTGDQDALDWAIPRTRHYIEQLRHRFPDLPIAVVTHGQEMFTLQKNNEYGSQAVHQQVKSLVEQQHVTLHVCGTYAGWKGLAEEDFPDYVDVAAAGPAQINDYLALGYVKIRITAED
jgi:intracellular sulfur oxidation DsrE/DsrF family protein